MNFSYIILQWLLLMFFLSPFVGPFVILLSLSLGAGISLKLKKRLDLFEHVLLFTAGTLGLLLLGLWIYSWVMGQSFLQGVEMSIKTFFADNSAGVNQVLRTYRDMGIIDQEYSAAYIGETLVDSARMMFPSAILIFSLVFGCINFLIARRIIKRFRRDVVDVPSFNVWTLPKGTVGGMITILIISLIGIWMGIENFQPVFMTIYFLFNFIFTVLGLSVGSFFLSKVRVPRILRVLILGLVVMIAPVITTFAGIAEQLFQLRRIYISRV